jgi:hypothetical protein
MSKKVKIFVIVIVVIIVIVIAISAFGSSSTPDTSSTGLTSSASGTVIPGGPASDPAAGNANQFSLQLANIKNITLDTSIFSSPAYKALQDNPVVLGTAVIGRVNPFAPIGSDSSVTVAAPILNIQTLAPSKITSTSASLGALVTISTATPVNIVYNYGTSDQFGSATTPVTVTKTGTALLTITGLTPSTTYYVEAVAVQGSTTATGSIMSFTTTAATQTKQ